MTLHAAKRDYLQQLKDEDCKYVVLKVEDLLGSMKTWEDFFRLQTLLCQYNEHRMPKEVNKYYVVNRDDVPKIKTAEEFFTAIKQLHDQL